MFHGVAAVHWLLLLALIVLPPWTALQQWALSWIAALFAIDTSHVRAEASIARLLLLVWASFFVAVNLRNRIAALWRQTSPASLPVIAVSVALALLFVGSLAAAGINVFFRSLQGTAARFPAIYLEDGLMENLTAAGYVLSALCLLGAALRTGSRYPAVAAALAVLALAGVFAGGEEMSWGQRVFGWYSPDYFSRNNVQQETNFHNLVSWNVMAYLTMLMAAGLALASVYADVFAVVFPIRGIERIVPAPAVRLALLIVPFTFSVVSYNEVTEEIASWILLCYSVQMLRAAGVPSSTPGPSPAR